jgi:ribosomal protein S18 acetylase RimI-like enzyme
MPEPGWTLRPATEDDREALFAMNRATMRDYVEAVWGWDDVSQRRRFDELFHPDRDLQIIEIGGQIVGMINAVERPDDLLLVNIRVLPEWQSRGIGAEVIGALIERAERAGKPVTLKVLKVNTRAQQLYRRMGFEVDHELEHHFWMTRSA